MGNTISQKLTSLKRRIFSIENELKIAKQQFEQLSTIKELEFPGKSLIHRDELNAVIDIPVVIKNVIYLSRTIIQKRVESCTLSSQLYRLFCEQLGNVTNDIFPDTREFEGIEIIRDPKEIFMRFSYKEDRKPREFTIVASPGRPNEAFLNFQQAVGVAVDRASNSTELIRVREVME